MNRLEKKLKEIYSPREAIWKRPVLFFLSIGIGALCFISGYAQIEHQWTNDGIWLVIALFGTLSIIGLLVSLFCSNFWVALILGRAP